jgi:VanZ family protein
MLLRPTQALFWTCAALLLGILIAGLWPFNFYPRNRVQWLRSGNGLHFAPYGQAYSCAPWALNEARKTEHSAVTIELWLLPADAYHPQVSPIFSIDGSTPDRSLNVAQSGSDLVVQAYFRSPNGGVLFHQLWMDDACRSLRPVFVTITSGQEGTLLSWVTDSQHTTKRYAGFSPADYLGHVVVGHAPTGNAAWTGNVYAVALYNRAITEDEMSQDYLHWLQGTPSLLSARALYAFDERSGNIVHNRAGTAPDLIIPARFRALHPTVLEFPHPFKRSDVVDSVVNIIGFIPLGFFFCAYLRERECSVHNAVAWTILFAFLTSIGIELLQVLLPSRDSSLLDVINNVLGGALGSALEVRAHDLWRRIVLKTARKHEA